VPFSFDTNWSRAFSLRGFTFTPLTRSSASGPVSSRDVYPKGGLGVRGTVAYNGKVPCNGVHWQSLWFNVMGYIIVVNLCLLYLWA